MSRAGFSRAFVLAALGGLAACIGPAGGPLASSNNANNASASTPLKPDANGQALVWNGEGVGSSAKSWTGCGKKDVPCRTTFVALPGVGHEGSTGLRLHGEGADWIGGGWNWFGWWPQNAGYDLSGFKRLTFWFRLEAKTPADAPDPAALTLMINASTGDKKQSEAVILTKYEPKAFDGNWHRIVIPLSDFLSGKGAGFNAKNAWELGVSTWSNDEKNFNLYFDDLAFAM